MKKTIPFLVHAGYWFLYCFLLFFMWHLLTMGHDRSDFGPSLFIYYAFTFVFAGVPALITFYVCYTLLFDHYLTKKKFVSLFVATIGASILSSIFAQLILYFSFWEKDYHMSRTLDTLIIMGAIMSINAMLNGIIAVILKGFLKWFKELDTQIRVEIS